MKKHLVTLSVLVCGVLACLTFAVHSQGPAQTRPSQGKFRRSAEPVPGQYIVVLDDAVVGPRGNNSRAAEIAGEMAAAHGGNVSRVYTHAIQGFSARLTEAAAVALSRDPRVALVEEDTYVHFDRLRPPQGLIPASGVQPLRTDGTQWGLDRIDQRDLPLDRAYHYQLNGAGVHVYVIDTGIRLSHQEFRDGSVNAAQAVRADVAFDACGGDGWDYNGHGTAVASIIGGLTTGVAKGVRLHSVRAVDVCTDANGSEGSIIISAVEWVTTNRQDPAIVNMSLAMQAYPTPTPPETNTPPAMYQAVAHSIETGVHYVVAAGNDRPNPDLEACHFTPANVPGAITVGASTIENGVDTRASFSKFGACVDMFAPGTGLRAASNEGDDQYADPAVTNGTSFAAPIVTGVLALEIQNQMVNGLPGPPTVQTTPCRLADAGAGSPNELVFSSTAASFCDLGSDCEGPNCRRLVGSIPAGGSTYYQPPCGPPYYTTTTISTHKAWLVGPPDADFDLTLMKEIKYPWGGTAMIIAVAGGTGPTSCEAVTYTGGPGTYMWRVRSKDKGGNYKLTYLSP